MPAAIATRAQLNRHKLFWGIVLISPWVLGLLLFKLIPIFTSLGFSFTDAYLLEPDQTKYVGLKNYLAAFEDSDGWTAMLNTTKLALWTIPLQTGTSLFVAGILNSKRLRMRNVLRVLFFLPSIIPSAAATFMWQGFIRPGSGWLYSLILDPLGLGEVIKFSSRSPTSGLIILASLWTIGPGILIILGAMQGIPSDVLEAATVDGAGRTRRFVSITLPLVSPATFFSLVLNLTAVFGGAILLDRGRTFNSNLSSYDAYIYSVLFRELHLGEASSLAWLYFIVVMLLLFILFQTSRKWVYFPEGEA